jgi:hypothetical protein
MRETAGTSSVENRSVRQQPNLITLISVALVAQALADVVHEVIGHGIAAQIAGVKILSISAIYVQTAMSNRFVAASGTIANLLIGAAVFFLLDRCRRFTAAQYFLWQFASFNVMNSGYLIYSAISGGGDWAVVISQLEPAWLWRAALGVAGFLLYWLAITFAARAVRSFVSSGELEIRSLPRLIFPAYFSAAALMLAAAALNPLRQFILVGGIGASLGLNAGLLFVPHFFVLAPRPSLLPVPSMPIDRFWLALAIVIATIFLGVLGPGISL